MNLPKTIMFYDGGCPLCSREIEHYRRLDSASRIDWIDISRDASLLQALGITLETAMARLHVLHRDGWLATGASAFAVVWSELPYYRWLARLVYSLNLLPLLERLYSRFARWRFQRRCREGVCAMPASWYDLSFRQGVPEPSHREVKGGLQTIPGPGFRHSLPE